MFIQIDNHFHHMTGEMFFFYPPIHVDIVAEACRLNIRDSGTGWATHGLVCDGFSNTSSRVNSF